MTKEDWWNHFVGQRKYHYNGVTVKRLILAKDVVLADAEIWDDVLLRHGGATKSPEQMKAEDESFYDHCMSNLGCSVYQHVRRITGKDI